MINNIHPFRESVMFKFFMYITSVETSELSSQLILIDIHRIPYAHTLNVHEN